MIIICGRKVKIRTGSKTQTVNICTIENVHGLYDYRIKFQPPSINENILNSIRAESVEALVRHLEEQYGGIVEEFPENYERLNKGSAYKRYVDLKDGTHATPEKILNQPQKIENWNGKEIKVTTSRGGVLAIENPYDNLISTGISPWPPPEIVQKLYQSRQLRAFDEQSIKLLTDRIGYYTDLQSINSEDTISWSVFGPLIYSNRETQITWVNDLLKLINIKVPNTKHSNIWLWRRIPHPDTMVSGGPEIDFGVQTENVVLLGEAKWKSGIAKSQGKNKKKDQITLRREFLEKYGKFLFRKTNTFIILGISLQGRLIEESDHELGDIHLCLRNINWDKLCQIDSHPCAEELRRYLKWKKEISGAYY